MNNLKEIRFFNNVSQALLALETGIQQARISLIENSLVVPRPDEKQKIAKALRVSIEDIFPEVGNAAQ
ncbi:MAG: helix-turn-helix transcriptional regulator [Syntrophaceae bacterium]|nr:helix-turn-helix transcriptional regulator [Syntrophaceae bacterium]